MEGSLGLGHLNSEPFEASDFTITNTFILFYTMSLSVILYCARAWVHLSLWAEELDLCARATARRMRRQIGRENAGGGRKISDGCSRCRKWYPFDELFPWPLFFALRISVSN